MVMLKRFRDEQFTNRYFYKEVWVVCPVCEKKAIASIKEDGYARLICTNCGHNKEQSKDEGKSLYTFYPAHSWFNVDLWFSAPFRGNTVWALNGQHLNYLEKYISSGIRENPKRTGYTLVEKLPFFMQSAKNRYELLKLISKLRNKVWFKTLSCELCPACVYCFFFRPVNYRHQRCSCGPCGRCALPWFLLWGVRARGCQPLSGRQKA